MRNLIQFLFFLIFLNAANSARILGVFHMPAYSHYQQGDRIVKELLARGHEVTVITPYEEKTPIKNLKQVLLPGFLEAVEPMKSKLFEQTEKTTIDNLLFMEHLGLELAEKTLQHENVQKLLKSNQQFDLVIHHQFMNDAHKGFCHHFNAPCVVLCPMDVPYWTHSQTANPDSPAYIADMFTDVAFDSSFTQRFLNSFIYIGLRLFQHFYTMPRQNEVLQKYFPNSPPLSELYYNTSLILINTHVSINPAVPYLPNMIDIGGFHVKPPKKLPQDLQEYLDNAKDGAIVFSLGSNLKSKHMTPEKRESILKAFSKLKQKVLWKWEEDNLPNQPANVKISKWLPQSDVLAHPNIKLVIIHGGLLSSIEALYHGKPFIGTSVFADQEKNSVLAEMAGFAISLPYKELTEEKLTHALNEMLSNPKYAENAKKRSEIMQDDPLKQLDKAIFWIEYVIRHNGAPHLRSAALDLRWYQYLLLDVVAVVILIVFVPLFVVIKIVKKCCRKSKKITETKVSKGKKKN